MGNESQVTQDEQISSGIPALDQASSSKCSESERLIISNGPEAKNKDNNNKKKGKDNKVKDNKIRQKDSKKGQ